MERNGKAELECSGGEHNGMLRMKWAGMVKRGRDWSAGAVKVCWGKDGNALDWTGRN